MSGSPEADLEHPTSARDGVRVLVVGHGPPTTGGIPTFITRLVADPWLAARAARVELLNTHPPGVKRPGALSFSNLRWTLTHAVELFRRARGADVVHLNLAATPTLPLVRALALSVAAKAAGARVLLHAHTGEIDTCLRNRTYRLLFRATASVVDAIVVVTRAQEDATRRIGIRNVHRIDNGLPVDRFATGPKEDPPIVAFVGTVCERKGLLDLCAALERLRAESFPLPRVVIAGDGEQEGPEAFADVVEHFVAAGIHEVEFKGAVDHDEIRRLLAGASIFCLPSHTEGFPLSLLEGMASGAAPVASSVGDVPVMLDGGKAGILVEPRAAGELAAALKRLLVDPAERMALSDRARGRVEAEYGFDSMVRELHELYVTLAIQGSDSAGETNP